MVEFTKGESASGGKVKEKSEEKKTTHAQGDRDKAVELAVAQIEKQFGKGAIMRLGKDIKINVPVIPTGALSLDLALGIGGVPRGRIVELFGPESSGKTTLTLSIIAETQKQGGVAAFIDAEYALDPGYARRLGVNLDDLLISQPDSGEQALEIAEMLIRSNSIDLVVVDSVAALVPEAEIKGEMGQPTMGLQARLMSQALRKLTAAISKSKTCVIFVNQIREKLGVMFGNPETTTGGRALKFYTSVRIDLRRKEVIKNGEIVIGNRIRAKVVKNKMAPPFREAEFDILFAEGIWRIGSILDVATELNVIQKTGSWLAFGEEKIGQGKENAAGFLKENPKILDDVEKKIHERVAVPS